MPTEIYKILNRLTGEVQFTAEIECAPDASPSIKLGLAVKFAIKSRADLSGANLSRADLSEANLSGADLSGANLSRADLSEADLSGAYLSGADLSGANLSGANLSGANLSRADLSGANLSGADLSGADLSRADLSGANLSDEQMRAFKADLWLTLTELAKPAEALFLIQELRDGRVDGSTYGDGKKCACLVGTIAKARDIGGENLDHDSDRPAERWFMMIKEGDLPTNKTGGGFAAKMALKWTEEWCAATGVDLNPSPETRSFPA